MRVRRAHTLGRLKKRPQFLAAAAGRRFHTDRMTLQGRLRDPDAGEGAGLRFGFTVTKKVGHATETRSPQPMTFLSRTSIAASAW